MSISEWSSRGMCSVAEEWWEQSLLILEKQSLDSTANVQAQRPLAVGSRGARQSTELHPSVVP